jgi:hypothetical protein
MLRVYAPIISGSVYDTFKTLKIVISRQGHKEKDRYKSYGEYITGFIA